ncbi:MAG: hypothetical protein JEZ14_17400 [Marinilabiliaceae bacterium]|nr:hypothetical protein [Marinilabiliaceae bacterium]
MIFSGVELLFFFLGFLSCLMIVGLIHLNRRNRLDWKAWLSIGLGAFLFLFCIAWSVSSVLEGEPRAASMGMVVFGLPALILLTLGMRLSFKKSV